MSTSNPLDWASATSLERILFAVVKAYVDILLLRRGKFATLKKNDIRINASIVEDTYLGGQMLVLGQNGQSFYYRIKVKNGKVIKGDLCMF